MDEKKKTYVEDIERTLYDIKNEDHSVYKSHSGLTPEIVKDISERKHDPAWMTEFRLKSLEVYNSLELPTWGPSLEELHMDDIVTYVQPDAKMTGSWEEVPEDIKDTVLTAIYKGTGINTDGQGIAFSVPVDKTAGLQ